MSDLTQADIAFIQSSGRNPDHVVHQLRMLRGDLDEAREYLEKGDSEGKSLLDAMRDGELDGMQHFDGELEKLARAGEISKKTAMMYATNPGNLQVQMVDVPDEESEVVITRGF